VSADVRADDGVRLDRGGTRGLGLLGRSELKGAEAPGASGDDLIEGYRASGLLSA